MRLVEVPIIFPEVQRARRVKSRIALALKNILIGFCLIAIAFGCGSPQRQDIRLPEEDYQYRRWVATLVSERALQHQAHWTRTGRISALLQAKDLISLSQILIEFRAAKPPESETLSQAFRQLLALHVTALSAARLDMGVVGIGVFEPFAAFYAPHEIDNAGHKNDRISYLRQYLALMQARNRLPPRLSLRLMLADYDDFLSFLADAPDISMFWQSDFGREVFTQSFRNYIGPHSAPSFGYIAARISAINYFLTQIQSAAPVGASRLPQLSSQMPMMGNVAHATNPAKAPIAFDAGTRLIDDYSEMTEALIGVGLPLPECVRSGLDFVPLWIHSENDKDPTIFEFKLKHRKRLWLKAQLDLGLHTGFFDEADARTFLNTQHITEIALQNEWLRKVMRHPGKALSIPICAEAMHRAWRAYTYENGGTFSQFLRQQRDKALRLTTSDVSARLPEWGAKIGN